MIRAGEQTVCLKCALKLGAEMAGRLEHALTHSDQPSREDVMGGKRSQVLSPEAAEYIVSWAEMTTGIAEYARWQ